MTRELKIGVIGTGVIFLQYIQAIKWINENTTNKIQIVAAVNRTKEGNERAASYGILNTYLSVHEMINKETLDAIFVLVRPEQITEVVMMLMSYQIPLLIEKPPGITLAEAESIAAESIRFNTSVMVAFNRRFYSIVKQADRIIQSSGGLLGMRMDGFERYRTYRENVIDISKLETLLTTNTIHCIDLIRHYAGETIQVNTFNDSSSQEPNNHRYASMIVTDRNIPVTFQSYWHAHGNWNYELYITDGKITFVNLEEAYFHPRKGEIEKLVPERYDIESKPGFVLQILYFANVVKEGIYLDGEMSIHDAVRTMRLVKQIEGVT
jgi:predicted dehydrogenase